MRGSSISAARRRIVTPALPTIVALGAANAGTTAAVAYGLPAGYAADDILLLPVESGQTAGLTPPTGWAHVLNSPRPQGTNVTSLSVFWKRAIASEATPSVPGAANHQTGRVIAIRGCVTSGNPWDIGAVNSAVASTTFSLALGTTTVANALLVIFAGSGNTLATDQFGAFTDASLANIIKQGIAGTANGNGGSVDLITGEKAVAGNAGTITATHTSGSWTGIALALKPAL